MTFLRPNMLRPALSTAPRARLQVRLAHQDYGSGAGNPAGENPQQQGKNPSEGLEHPGPAPPKVGQNKTSPSEGTTWQSSSESSHSQTSTSSQTQSESNDGATQGGATSSKVKGAQPRILNANPPTGKENEQVKQHNEEMDHRAERPHEQVSNEDAGKDKVPSGYWKGHGGVDQDP